MTVNATIVRRWGAWIGACALFLGACSGAAVGADGQTEAEETPLLAGGTQPSDLTRDTSTPEPALVPSATPTVDPFATPTTPTALPTRYSATPRSHDPQEGIYSPDGAYSITCVRGLRMYRTADGALIGEAGLTLNEGCPLKAGAPPGRWPDFQWAGNSSAFAFISDENVAYIWSVDESYPERVAESISAIPWVGWSPDSTRLAVLVAWPGTPQYAYGTMLIHDLGSDPVVQYSFQMTPMDGWGWYTNEVIKGGTHLITSYYQARTGQHITSWYHDPRIAMVQPLFLSPDQRWLVLEHVEYSHSIAQGFVIEDRTYAVYDLMTGDRSKLSDGLDRYIQFLGWSEDSEFFYLVSRPAHTNAYEDPAVPFGLLAFSPTSQRFELLFKEAIQVNFRGDRRWALVVFPERSLDGSLGIAAGLWEVGTDNLIGRTQVSDHIIYRDPAYAWYMDRPIVPVQWSEDGNVVTFGEEGWVLEVPNG